MLPALLGGAAALASALAFAVASIFFRRLGEAVSPVGTNLAKGLLSVVLMLFVVAAGGMADIPLRAGIFLGLSGLLGITIGDTAYFAALNALGPRRTLLLDTLSPGLTALLAVIVLGERLSLLQVAGIAVTLAGIGTVMRGRQRTASPAPAGSPTASATRVGVLWALCAVGCHAGGVLLAKDALREVPALEASLVRQAVAVAAVMAWVGVRRGIRTELAPLRQRRYLMLFLGASIAGSFAGIWLSMLGLRLADASIAATLNATTPIFVLPLAALFDRDRLTPRAVLGACVAVVGVAVLLVA